MYNPHLAFESLDSQKDAAAKSLLETMRYVAEKSPFYKKLFKEKAIQTDCFDWDDFQKIPFITKEDLQQYNFDFLCTSRNEIAEYTATSGTLGKPVTIAQTSADLSRLAYNEAQSFRCAEGTGDDVYQLMLTLDKQFMAGMAYYNGILQMGGTVIRTGPGMPKEQWETIQRCGTSTIVGVPSFFIKMAEYAASNAISLEDSSVKRAICIGEGLQLADFTPNALGEKLNDLWPIAYHSTYASTEMQTAFTACEARQGGHVQPDLIYVEIIDEEGNAVKDRKAGEIVISTFGITGMPLLRYRTGDIASMHMQPCICGRFSPRLGPIIGRRQQMLKLKGTTLYPPAIFELLNSILQVKNYFVEATTNELGQDAITIFLTADVQREECFSTVIPVLKDGLRVLPNLIFLEREEAILAKQSPTGSRKMIRFLDSRIKM